MRFLVGAMIGLAICGAAAAQTPADYSQMARQRAEAERVWIEKVRARVGDAVPRDIYPHAAMETFSQGPELLVHFSTGFEAAPAPGLCLRTVISAGLQTTPPSKPRPSYALAQPHAFQAPAQAAGVELAALCAALPWDAPGLGIGGDAYSLADVSEAARIVFGLVGAIRRGDAAYGGLATRQIGSAFELPTDDPQGGRVGGDHGLNLLKDDRITSLNLYARGKDDTGCVEVTASLGHVNDFASTVRLRLRRAPGASGLIGARLTAASVSTGYPLE